ncbi:hypothetical protein JW948_06865 [bacterium]|nr:hypothetical protein [bacterium]
MRKIIIGAGCILIVLAGCHRKTETAAETIIARIGDRTISKNEFIRRAEYTIRPDYCKFGDNIIHKKIILNSLIAEKLMALEAGGENALMQSERFQAFVRGRREQAMRKLLYAQEAYDRVRLDEEELSAAFKIAGRKYHVAYFTVPDSGAAADIESILNRNPDRFESVFGQYFGDQPLPDREVAWVSEEDPAIEAALFSTVLKDSTVIGPVTLENGQILFMRINGWTDQKVFTEPDVQERWRKVRQDLTLKKATVLWDSHIRKIMKGKRIEFQEETFYRLADIFAEQYHFQDQDKKDMFNDQFWDRQGLDSDSTMISGLPDREEALQSAPLFTLDGQVFSVRNFYDMLRSHPLVFRKRRFSNREFPGQLQLAIVDMVRDRFLTDEAYQKGLDKHPWVERAEMMWQDAIVARYYRNSWLQNAGKKDDFIRNYMTVLHNDLNPYVRSLQKKYSSQIEIDTDLLKKIQLTRTDMFVIQKWESYPVIVPQFPMLTDEHLIDYGREMGGNP